MLKTVNIYLRMSYYIHIYINTIYIYIVVFGLISDKNTIWLKKINIPTYRYITKKKNSAKIKKITQLIWFINKQIDRYNR